VKDGMLLGADVAADTRIGAQIDESTLGTVPSAANASSLGGLPASSWPGVNGLAVGDTAILVPDAANWPKGIVYMPLRSDKANTFALELCNPTNSSVSTGGGVTVSIWPVKLAP
jgi:hypothetical protein